MRLFLPYRRSPWCWLLLFLLAWSIGLAVDSRWNDSQIAAEQDCGERSLCMTVSSQRLIISVANDGRCSWRLPVKFYAGHDASPPGDYYTALHPGLLAFDAVPTMFGTPQRTLVVPVWVLPLGVLAVLIVVGRAYRRRMEAFYQMIGIPAADAL